MTDEQKILAVKLLKGWCLVKTVDKKRNRCYRLLDENYLVQEIVKARVVDGIDNSVKGDLVIWKWDKWKRITFNLSTIRKLHGRHTLKRMYKMKEQLEVNHSIVKTKNNRKKLIKNNNDEKVLSLF